ncbi:glycoside hydrolase family 113 [Bacillus sp. Wb]
MKKNVLLAVFLIFCIVVYSISNLFFQENHTKKIQENPKHNIHKGVALTLLDPYNTDNFYDKNLPKIKEMGAELEVVTKVSIQSTNDSMPVNDPNIEDKFNRLFSKSKEYGVKVSVIKPHIMFPGDGFDRGTYNPSNTNDFFKRWKEIILYYAKVSHDEDVPFLSITCETSIITQNTYIPYWQEIINEIKQKYPDVQVTMALKKSDLDREIAYHEKGVISILDYLDVVSLNMFPRVKRDYVGKNIIAPSDDAFVSVPGAYGFITSIKKVKEYFKKDVIITETGSSPRSDFKKDYLNPFNFDQETPKNHRDQNDWMKIVLDNLFLLKEVKGIYIWHIDQPFDFLDTKTADTIRKKYRN